MAFVEILKNRRNHKKESKSRQKFYEPDATTMFFWCLRLSMSPLFLYFSMPVVPEPIEAWGGALQPPQLLLANRIGFHFQVWAQETETRINV